MKKQFGHIFECKYFEQSQMSDLRVCYCFLLNGQAFSNLQRHVITEKTSMSPSFQTSYVKCYGFLLLKEWLLLNFCSFRHRDVGLHLA